MNNKIVEKFFIAIFRIISAAFFLGLIVLAFYNHTSADDYFALYHYKSTGFIGFQKFVYLHWGGRYFSNLMAALFSANAFMVHYYYFHTILLIALTIISAYTLLTVTNRYLANKSIIKRDRILFSLLVTINLYCCYPELSSALFWFSSAITYQTSIILLMLLVSVVIYWLNTNYKLVSHKLLLVAVFLLIFAINGTNEVAAILSGVILIVLCIIYFKSLADKKLSVICITLMYFASILLLILSPGNKERMTVLDGKSVNIVLSVVSAFYRVFVIYWNIFQSVLFWASLAGILLYVIHIREKIFILKHHKPNIKTIFLFVAIWSILLLIVLIPILLLSNGSIPDRALNVLSAASVLVFFMLSFYIGMCIKNTQAKQVFKHQQLVYGISIILLISIVANKTTKDIVSSLISAKGYHQAMLNREINLAEAKQLNRDSVSLPLIETAMFLYANQKDQKAILKEWMQKKPVLLFVSDDLATEGSRKILQDYYEISKISISDK